MLFGESVKRLVTRGLRGLGIFIAVAAIAAVWNRERLVRLHAANTLFKEDRIVSNFSNMKDLFHWAPIPRSGEIHEWPEALAALPETYAWNGENHGVSDWLEKTGTTSLLVLRDGMIVSERYFLGTAREETRISWSMAKSFLSALFGIALEDGKIASIDDLVTDYAPILQGSAYDGVRIREVLHMASGVEFDEDYLSFSSDINRMGRVLALGGSMDEFASEWAGREREAGIRRDYASIDTHVIAMVLRGATGMSLRDYMTEKLWSRLGAEDDAYYLTDGHGVAFALGGLNMRTRDFARFGQLFVDGGQWRGEQIVPARWVRESVRDSAPPSVSEVDPFGYGYQWWVPVDSDGEFFAIGIYGQYLYVNPKARVVVVKTSAHRGFRNDGATGHRIKLQTIAMFRSIAEHYSTWRHPNLRPEPN
jgi:hypothetical protein